MAHDSEWQRCADRLRKMPGIDLVTFEIGAPITADDRAVAEVLNAAGLPKPVMAALDQANGVKLVWKGDVGDKPLQGSINVLPYMQVVVRAGATEDDAPLEGVLWDEEFPDAVKRDLQQMTVFEALAGRSAHLAYRVDDPEAKLHLVEGDQIRQLVPDFETVLTLLARYAGADGLREQLTYEDWEQRLAADKQLQEVAGT